MLVALALPIILSAVAMFFLSFLSWMVLQLHKSDWNRLAQEDEILGSLAKCQVPNGNYMFPMPMTPAEMQSPEFQKKYDAGPRGLLTITPKVNMGRNLGLTFVYYLVVSFLVGYLASTGLPKGSEFLLVFRFIFTAAFLGLLASIVQHAIWFRIRVTGHIIETVLQALASAAIFAALWPQN